MTELSVFASRCSSPFPERASRLAIQCGLEGIQARRLHLIKAPAELNADRRVELERAIRAHWLGSMSEFIDSVTAVNRLARRMDDRVHSHSAIGHSAQTAWGCFVYPRPGIISPWSSQATEILKRAGLKIEGIEYVVFYSARAARRQPSARQLTALHDRMIEVCDSHLTRPTALQSKAETPRTDRLLEEGTEALVRIDTEWGLSLSDQDIKHLSELALRRRYPLTASEVMMYAQVNSEHCRHKLFNGRWVIGGVEMTESLFALIKQTHARSPEHTLEAYHDNAAVLSGFEVDRWLVDPNRKLWYKSREDTHFCIKVESHNHPTAILPFAGAATGAGGEIRDENATGRGACPIGGFSGYMVSDLLIPDAKLAWETDIGYPKHIQSAFTIMLEAPIGAAQCNNEFGRTSLSGFFRTLSRASGQAANPYYGFHKPVMLAGGYAAMRGMHRKKRDFSVNSPIIALGGPAMLLGLGGGSLSSQPNLAEEEGEGKALLDFASVQRSNPEVQRRCHEVLRQCMEMGENNPIASVHDVGAGGLSNAVSEIVAQMGKGADIDLDRVPRLDYTMTPEEIWCNESQERYVLIVESDRLELFESICRRERCLNAVIGTVSQNPRIVVRANRGVKVVDLAIDDLIEPRKRTIDIPDYDEIYSATASSPLESESRLEESVIKPEDSIQGSPQLAESNRRRLESGPSDREEHKLYRLTGDDQPQESSDEPTTNQPTNRVDLNPAIAVDPGPAPAGMDGVGSNRMQVDSRDFGDLVRDVLHLPAVGSKRFLITIGDRSVGGLTCRDQMVGPFQEPVADVAVSRLSMDDFVGTAMAIGERAGMAAISPLAASRLALCEALTNVLAADIERLSQIRLSANWMVASGEDLEDRHLYQAVKTLCQELVIPLGLSIPVGKDSVNMRTRWRSEKIGGKIEVKSPLTLVISAFAKIKDIRRTLTPWIPHSGITLIKIPMVENTQRNLGGSALAYTRSHWWSSWRNTPDCTDAKEIRRWFDAVQAARSHFLSYHDVSDGGLLTCATEMALCSRMGLDIELADDCDPIAELFNEEPAVVVAVANDDVREVTRLLARYNQIFQIVGRPNGKSRMQIQTGARELWSEELAQLWQWWHHTSFQMQSHRDDPDCAQSEWRDGIASFAESKGLSTEYSFKTQATAVQRSAIRPRVCVLREQGCNGHAEMAYAFDKAGFAAYDVCMQDLLDGRVRLNEYQALVACGGFSYGDVLGAGWGWALGVIQNPKLSDIFYEYFHRSDTLSLGVCNGCQFMSYLKDLIPEADHWPTFHRNNSRRFESRLVRVIIEESGSVWTRDMRGAQLPVVASHGEGRVVQTIENSTIAFRYIDYQAKLTQTYPHNPNGSVASVAGLNSKDGRAMIMMPHPERMIDPWQYSWIEPHQRKKPSPWMQLFHNARRAFNW